MTTHIKRAVADIETDGLLNELSVLYCGSVRDYDTSLNRRFRDVRDLVHYLSTFDEVWFHNGCTFDYPALCLLYPSTPFLLPKSKVRDTLVLSRLLFPVLAKNDAARSRKMSKTGQQYQLPPKLTGSHALQAWGYRLGDYKGDFSPASKTNPATGNPHTWHTVGYSEEMADYCDQDTSVTLKLLELLLSRPCTTLSANLEHDIAWLMAQMEANGFKFDRKNAVNLYAELCAKRAEATHKVITTFGHWYVANGVTHPKRNVKYKDKYRGDITQGAPYTKIKLIEYNPASRAHAVRCFKKWYGWVPTVFTPAGEPKIDADVLDTLPYPEAAVLKGFFDIAKMIGQLAEGKQAWLKAIKEDGHIHGRVNPNGAGTGRATHSSPNVAQVPKGPEGTYGRRCRELFTVPDNWVLLGTDAAGLELRCLGNALAPYDGGKYSETVINGDIHWHNTLALGLMPKGTIRDKENPIHEQARDLSKTWIYAFLYGAGDELLGATVGYTQEDRDYWRSRGTHVPIIKRLRARGITPTIDMVCNMLKGAKLRSSFLKAVPAIKSFQQECKTLHTENGGVTGLDGRIIPTRSAHSATNFRLQGDGALICKLWGVLIEQRLLARGFKHGFDGDFAYCAWVHDEYQIACRTKEIAEIVGTESREAIVEVGKTFGISCDLDADFKIGPNWGSTH
jgi:DNA polymerase-1